MLHHIAKKAPAAGIAAAFFLTVAGARIFSLVLPRFHWEPKPGMHIHHYVYGIFILVIAGYLALIFRNDGATPWITLLYGLGVGLTFDEFSMWLNPVFQEGRWNKSGIMIVIVALLFVGFLLPRRAPKRENALEIARSNTLEEVPEEVS